MKLYNLKDKSEEVNFQQAVKQGLGRNQGLFFPDHITPLADVDALLNMNLVDRSTEIISHLLGDELSKESVASIVKNAFTFEAPVKKSQITLMHLSCSMAQHLPLKILAVVLWRNV